MQTGIAVHDTDHKQGNGMNNNPNHGSSRKEKQMHAITKATFGTVLIALGLALTAQAAEPPKAEPQKGKDAAGAALPPPGELACVFRRAWAF